MTDIKFDEKFIQEVMNRYSTYINARCKISAEHQIQDPVWGQEDIQQEIYIHIWRFCTKASQEFSTEDNIWLPHMEMILRNVIKNILEGYGKFKRSDSLIDYTKDQDPVNHIDKTLSEDPYESVNLANFLVHVRKRIKPEYREYFEEIVNPSDQFKSFIRNNTPEGRTIRITKTIMAKYFRISYNKALAVFKDMEGSFEFCNKFA